MAEKQKDSLLKNIAIYSSSNIYRQLLSLINAFIRPKLLSPELYGLWSLLSLLSNYATYSDLGSRISMRFLIPYNEARNKRDENEKIKASALYGPLLIRLTLVLAIIVYTLVTEHSREVIYGLYTIATVILLRWYHGYYISLLKSQQNFKLVAKANYIRTSISVFIGAVLIYLFGIYGLYLTIILTYAAVITYLLIRHPLGSHPDFSLDVFGKLVRMGFPIMVYNVFILLIRSADRIIIASYLGTKELGFYAIAGMVFSFLMQIPGATREVIEPRLMQDMATMSKEKNLKEYFLKPLVNTAYFMPFLIGAVFFIMPVLIPLILPRYIPGIQPLQILIFGGYFLSLSFVARGTIVSNNWQTRVLALMAFCVLINIGLSLFLIQSGLGLSGVAIGSSISFFTLFICLLSFIYRESKSPLVEWKKNIIGMSLPFPVMCLTIALLHNSATLRPINDIAYAIAALCIYSLIMLTVLQSAQKKYPLLQGVKFSNSSWKYAIKSFRKNI